MGNLDLNIVECCNIKQIGRVYDIKPKNKMRRVLVFIDKCKQCGQPKAIIKNIEFDGTVKNTIIRTGKKALKLYNNYSNIMKNFEYKVQKGNKSNMWWFYFDGIDQWIKDFNGTKILKIN